MTDARRRREVEREREGRRRRARETQAAQEIAAAAKVRKRRVRYRVEGAALIVLAVIIALTHAFEHAGAIRIMNQSAEDLFLGIPDGRTPRAGGVVRLGR